MLHNVVFHLNLHCLRKYPFRGFQICPERANSSQTGYFYTLLCPLLNLTKKSSSFFLKSLLGIPSHRLACSFKPTGSHSCLKGQYISFNSYFKRKYYFFYELVKNIFKIFLWRGISSDILPEIIYYKYSTLTVPLGV